MDEQLEAEVVPTSERRAPRSGLAIVAAAAIVPLAVLLAWAVGGAAGTVVIVGAAAYAVFAIFGVVVVNRQPRKEAAEAVSSIEAPVEQSAEEVEAEEIESAAEAKLRRLTAERRSLLEEIVNRNSGEEAPPVAASGWNIWELERTAAEARGNDPAADYERSLLLVYMRDFADSAGHLSGDFDELIREAFPERVAESPAS